MHNLIKLALNSLWFYRRTNIGVWLGIAVGAAVFTGAMIVGDSINETLKRQALERIGETSHIVSSGERLFTPQLADSLQNISKTNVAPVLLLPGTVSSQESTIHKVQLLGVDERFFNLWTHHKSEINLSELKQNNSVCINQHLAKRMGLQAGDDIVIRVQKPLQLPANIPLANRESLYVSRRVKVETIIDDFEGGRFALNPQQVAPGSIFMPLDMLADLLGQETSANLLLLNESKGADVFMAQLQKSWTLEDIGLDIGYVQRSDEWELRSKRFFIDSSVSQNLEESGFPCIKILTYLVNSLGKEGQITPYSFVAGISETSDYDLSDPDGIVINDWLHKDLNANTGDTITLTYYSIGTEGGLTEESQELRVEQILSMNVSSNDRDLIPSIPGLSDNEDCREWDPGFPIDLSLIRDKDEAYWDEFGGSPKAYISSEMALELWSNPYGNYTALRFPGSQVTREELSAYIRENVPVASLGFRIVGIRDEALSAADQALDFRHLFIGLSFVVIAGALLLTGMIFRAGLMQRREEISTLQALGYSLSQLLRYFCFEYFLLILSASFFGALLGVVYNFLIVSALKTVWGSVIGATDLYISIKPYTLFIGILAGVFVSFTILVIGLLRFTQVNWGQGGVRTSLWTSTSVRKSIFFVSVGALTLVFTFMTIQSPIVGSHTSIAFFCIGFVTLLSLLGLTSLNFFSLQSSKSTLEFPNRRTLTLKQLRRDPWHSISVIALISVGMFSVIGVGSNRSEISENWTEKTSGTGGFALYGETAFPMRKNLNDSAVRYQYGLDSDLMDGVVFSSILQYGGVDASCFNLNRISRPRLLGVNVKEFTNRGAFRFLNTDSDPSGKLDWSVLDEKLGEGVIPGVMDYTVMQWGLGIKVGDTLEYQDEQGRPLSVQLVGAIDSSIFQGSVIVSDENIRKYFPTESSTQVLLVDVSIYRNISDVSSTIYQALQDFGIDIQTTRERLNSFKAVENTYLSIFLSLGGLGMMIGLLGFGIATYREIVNRRSEFAILRAVGFSQKRIQTMCLLENVILLTAGLLIGLISALIAIYPNLLLSGKSIPWMTLFALVTSITLVGIISSVGAIHIGLKGTLIAAIRQE
jgi:ABC-type lipoprotein release transport system permease subunit